MITTVKSLSSYTQLFASMYYSVLEKSFLGKCMLILTLLFFSAQSHFHKLGKPPYSSSLKDSSQPWRRVSPSLSSTNILIHTPTPTISSQQTSSPFSSKISPNTKILIESLSGISIDTCLNSLGSQYTYGAIDSIGDGWCDDPLVNSGSSTLFNLNTAACGYDGGDCCMQTCNYNASIYGCRISGFHCSNQIYKNLSSVSNFTFEVIGTNYSEPLSVEESNAIFLLGLQYELIDDETDSFSKVSMISAVQSRFSTLMNRSVVIVDAVITTYTNLVITSPKRRLRDFLEDDDSTSNTDTGIIPSVNALPGLERSVRLAATRANIPSLSFAVLCRNGLGLEQCLSRGQNDNQPQPLTKPQTSSSNLQCFKYADGYWQKLYGRPTSFPSYACYIIVLICAWGIIGFLSLYHAIQLKLLSPKEGIIQQQKTTASNRISNNTTIVATEAARICFRVFLFWMLTIVALLRTLYFMWLLLWPSAVASSGTYNKTESYIACREFYFLNFRNDFANTANVSAAYQFVLGWFYIFLVMTVQMMTEYEWKCCLQLQQTQQGQLLSQQRDDLRARLHSTISKWIHQIQTVSMVTCFTCAFIIIVISGMLWDYQHAIKRDVPVTATVTLLVIQSICGLLLCACFAPMQYLLSLLCESNSTVSTTVSPADIQNQYFHKIFAMITALMGILFLIGAHGKLLAQPVAAFLWYSLFPRLLEFMLIVIIIIRLSGQSVSKSLRYNSAPSFSQPNIGGMTKSLSHCQMIQPSSSPSRNGKRSSTTNRRQQEQQLISVSQQSIQPQQSQRPSSNYRPIISDRFTDVESNLFPPWIQSWRSSPQPTVNVDGNEIFTVRKNQKLDGMIDTVSDVYLDDEILEQLHRMSESTHGK